MTQTDSFCDSAWACRKFLALTARSVWRSRLSPRVPEGPMILSTTAETLKRRSDRRFVSLLPRQASGAIEDPSVGQARKAPWQSSRRARPLWGRLAVSAVIASTLLFKSLWKPNLSVGFTTLNPPPLRPRSSQLRHSAETIRITFESDRAPGLRRSCTSTRPRRAAFRIAF